MKIWLRGTTITSSFAALAPDGTTVLTAATMTIYSIVDNYGTDRSSEFTIVSDGSGAYHLETNSTFWWSADPNLRVFGITLQVTNGSISNNIGFAGFMGILDLQLQHQRLQHLLSLFLYQLELSKNGGK